MSGSGFRWLRLFRESFVPVMIVILGLFLVLLYVQFRTEYDADKVTVIDIQPVALGESESESAEPGDSTDVSSSAESGVADPERQRARALMAQKKWADAERIFQAILKRRRSARGLKDLGVLYLKKGDMTRALKYFDQAVEANPADRSALFNRALALARGGRKREALEGYRALLAKQPNHFPGLYNMALLLMEQGDKSGASDALEKAIQISSGKHKAHALYQLGLARREMGQITSAAKAFESAIRLQPQAPEPRVALATLEPDNPEGRVRALAQYRKILELAPDYSPALVNMASILNAQDKPHEAEQALRQAIQSDAADLRAHTTLGLFLLEHKRWQDARAEFEWVLQQDKSRADAYFNLGRIAYGEKDYDKAISAYQAALKTTPGSYPEALLNLGLAYSAKNDYVSALATYEAARSAKKEYPEAWYNIGMVYLHRKDYPRAEQAFGNAVRQRPDYEQAWFNLGVVYGNVNRDPEAIEAYHKALSIRPDYSQAEINLAVRYAKRKEYGEAIRLYRAIVARDESYAVAWFDLGNAYIGNHQPAEAVAALRKANALDPSNTKTLRLLGRALLLDKKSGEAVQVLQNAVAADSADVRLRLDLARALRQSGRDNEARDELAKAKQLDPNIRGDEQDAQGNTEP